MAQETTAERAQRLISPILEQLGFELVELEFKREGRDWFLRIFIDKEGGVTLDDCADVSREVDALLDVEDLIDTAYRLEVSSPGIDRPLRNARDYERFRGRLVKVKTFEPLDPDARGHSRKTFVGELLGLDGEMVQIRQTDKKGGVVVIPLSGIAKANIEFEF